MNATSPLNLLLAAVLATGSAYAMAQAPSTPTAPASPVTPPAATTPPTPGSPEVPIAPGTLPEQAAPAPAAPSPAQAIPTGSAAAQTSVPSGEVAKALQTGESAHGGKTTEDAPASSPAITKTKKSRGKHGTKAAAPAATPQP